MLISQNDGKSQTSLRGDLGPCHCHYLVHSQSYKVSVGGGLCMDWLWWNLIRGGGNRLATTASNAWATLFNSSSKARNSVKMSTFGDLQKKRGKLLNSFSLFFSSFLFYLYISYIFVFVFVLCVGLQTQFCRGFNGLSQVIYGAHIVLLITGHL